MTKTEVVREVNSCLVDVHKAFENAMYKICQLLETEKIGYFKMLNISYDFEKDPNIAAGKLMADYIKTLQDIDWEHFLVRAQARKCPKFRGGKLRYI